MSLKFNKQKNKKNFRKSLRTIRTAPSTYLNPLPKNDKNNCRVPRYAQNLSCQRVMTQSRPADAHFNFQNLDDSYRFRCVCKLVEIDAVRGKSYPVTTEST